MGQKLCAIFPKFRVEPPHPVNKSPPATKESNHWATQGAVLYDLALLEGSKIPNNQNPVTSQELEDIKWRHTWKPWKHESFIPILKCHGENS